MEAIPTKQEATLIQQLDKEVVFRTRYRGGIIKATSDGSHLIWVAEDATTVNVSPLHGKVQTTYKGDTSEVLAIALSYNNKYMAVSYSTGLIYIYDLAIPNTQIMIIKVCVIILHMSYLSLGQNM